MPVELWVALDVSNKSSAVSWAKRLQGCVDVFKIGLELFTADGPSIVTHIKELGCRVFLDLKFHDIPNTIAGAVRNITQLGVDYFDLHVAGGPEMMKAAVEAANEESEKCGLPGRPKILAITVLTSLSPEILKQLKINQLPVELVKEWALLAKSCGMDGVVNSIHEVKAVRQACGSQFLSVTPGIRPKEKSAKDDQRRTGTPQDAVIFGSSAIVVGRPILKAKDPVSVAYNMKQELKEIL